MKSEGMVERNIALIGYFMEYLIDHPKIFESLPDDFELLILPEDDTELAVFNLDLLKQHGRENKPIVFVCVKSSAEKITSAPNIFVPIAA